MSKNQSVHSKLFPCPIPSSVVIQVRLKVLAACDGGWRVPASHTSPYIPLLISRLSEVSVLLSVGIQGHFPRTQTVGSMGAGGHPNLHC